jgi:ABC-type transport system involved in multi-copper enzyme maturation permease subunit
MFTLLLLKEIRALLYSPKFLISFALASVLLITSFWIGVREYKEQRAQYGIANDMARQQMQEQRRWAGANMRVYREPQPMQILSSGIAHDAGRYAIAGGRSGAAFDGSTYAQDPLFALFRMVDPALVVQVIFSLFAIVFTYDSICGEREDGTLKLMMANAISRGSVIVAKVAGAAIGLLVPMLIPFLVAALFAVVTGVFSSASHWIGFGMFVLVSFVYIGFFLVTGVTVSAFTSRTSVSFLLLLVLWIGTVLIIPRAGVMTAAQWIHVPDAAEVESQRSAFEQQQWDGLSNEMTKLWRERTEFINTFPESERAAKREEMEWDWSEQDAERRRTIETAVNSFRQRLEEDVRNRRNEQSILSLKLARISPASQYQLAVNRLTGTGLALKNDMETAFNAYQDVFKTYTQQKAAQSNDAGGIRITFDSNTGARFDLGPQRNTGLDISDLPAFETPVQPMKAAVTGMIPDLTLLCGALLAVFMAGFVRFQRYDVR